MKFQVRVKSVSESLYQSPSVADTTLIHFTPYAGSTIYVTIAKLYNGYGAACNEKALKCMLNYSVHPQYLNTDPEWILKKSKEYGA